MKEWKYDGNWRLQLSLAALPSETELKPGFPNGLITWAAWGKYQSLGLCTVNSNSASLSWPRNVHLTSSQKKVILLTCSVFETLQLLVSIKYSLCFYGVVQQAFHHESLTLQLQAQPLHSAFKDLQESMWKSK